MSSLDNFTDEVRRVIVLDNAAVLRDFFNSFLPMMFPLETTIGQAQIRLAAALRCYDGTPYTVAELAATLGRPRSTVQQTIDASVERGMFYFEKDPDDARVRRIRVTPEGWERIRGFEDALIEHRMVAGARLQAILNETTSKALSQDIVAVLESHGFERTQCLSCDDCRTEVEE